MGALWLWVLIALAFSTYPEWSEPLQSVDGALSTLADNVALLVAFFIPASVCGLAFWIGATKPRLTIIALMSASLVGVLVAAARGGLFAELGDLSADDLVLVIAVFPILNALADICSLGLTRYCLRRGLSGRERLFALIDICGGLLIFLALGFATITYIHVLNVVTSPDPISLGSLFVQLDPEFGPPGNYWWLSAFLFTTLMPTAAHVSVAVFCFALYYPDWIKRPIVTLLSASNEEDYPTAWLGSALLCTTITASVSLVYWALYALASLDGGALLSGIIAIFEGFARLIGAL